MVALPGIAWVSFETFFLDGPQKHVFWHERGRGKSYRHETRGKLRSFSTRILWDRSRTPKPRKSGKKSLDFIWPVQTTPGL